MPQPQISSIEPNQVPIGTTSQNVILRGAFNSNPKVSVSGSGITAGSETLNNDGTISVTFTISSSATVKGYLVTEQDDGGQSSTQVTFRLAPSMMVSGNDANSIFVGTDPGLAPANTFIAQVQPTGGSFAASSSDTSDTFTPPATLGGFPKVSITTNDQSQASGDRKLTFKYTVNSVTTTQTLAVTARKFAFAQNGPLSNVCSGGFGYQYVITYTPGTHPDGALAQPGIGLTGASVTESVQPGNDPAPCGNLVTGNGALDANSQFSDTLQLCSTSPIPVCKTTLTQAFSVAGFVVRNNILVFTNNTLTYTNKGPNQ